jgi:hypothetical protein
VIRQLLDMRVSRHVLLEPDNRAFMAGTHRTAYHALDLVTSELLEYALSVFSSETP